MMRTHLYLSLICALILPTLITSHAPQASAQGVQCEQPNALIILDRSGSMSDNNKWDTAVRAIDDLTLAFDSKVRFGLSYFPTDGRCSTNNNLLQGVAPNNGVNIRADLQQLGDPGGNGATPIASALQSGTNYFRDLNDLDRNNVLILITDGDQTCDNAGNPVDRAREAAQAGFPVYVISFGNGVRSPGVLTNIAREGGTNDYYQADNADALINSLIEIVTLATSETCDSQDNDCDGLIDEDIPPQPCETDCGRGEKICVDGQLSICTGGDIPIDSCDGEDNDCDGFTDEVGYDECVTPSGNEGRAECLEGGVVSEICEPDDPDSEEVCDGRDNNMNGQIDENTDEECNIECHIGRRRCVEGVLLGCSAPPVGDERCNGYDDDCDGLIDESAMCVGEEVCGSTGECLQPCVNGECFGDFVCNSDDICERSPCPTPCGEGQRCVDQRCITPCLSVSQCGDYEICDPELRICVPDPRPRPTEPQGGESAGGMSIAGDNTSPVAGTSGDTSGGTSGGTEVPAGFLSPSEPNAPAGGSDSPNVETTGASCYASSGSTSTWGSIWALLALAGLLGCVSARRARAQQR